MTYDLITSPDAPTPQLYLGPEGSPNGTLTAPAGTIVLTTDGSIYIKTIGSDADGWTQVPTGDD